MIKKQYWLLCPRCGHSVQFFDADTVLAYGKYCTKCCARLKRSVIMGEPDPVSGYIDTSEVERDDRTKII